MQSSTDSSQKLAPQRRRLSNKIVVGTAGLLILVILAGTGWWLLSPLFIHSTGKVSNPFAQSSQAKSTAPVGTSTVLPTPNSPVTLATGKFIDNLNSGQGLANDHGSGNVTIGKTSDGQYIIHLDQLNVTNGPDLHVYLSSTAIPDNTDQVKSGVDLGTLSASEGSVNVAIPAEAGARLAQYHSVVIYCKTFAVIFTAAPLEFSSN